MTFSPEALILLYEAIKIQNTYFNYLLKIYDCKTANEVYDRMTAYFHSYQSEKIKETGYDGLCDIILKDSLIYATIVHQAVNYAIDKIKEEEKHGRKRKDYLTQV